MSKDWTPETLKEYTDVQFQMMQDEIDRRFEGQEHAFIARNERSTSQLDLVNVHLARIDEALAQVQGGQRASTRLWTLLIAGIAATAGIVAAILYSIPHK